MPFLNDFQRVLYAKNPLETVICQVRFPTILRIDSEVPAAFQEAIRDVYPVYKETRTSLESQDPTGLVKLLGNRVPAGLLARTAYEFVSEDEVWQVSLTRDFVALSCRKYARWETFRERLEPALAALLAEYRPTFFSRIGLRYQNVIRRSSLNLEDTPWSELLKPHIAGELADAEIADAVQNVAKEILIQLPEGQVRIRHGLAGLDDEQAYLIDSDFFLDTKTETNDAWNVLNHFNSYAGRLFRWCIQDKLHEGMGPEALGE